MSAPSQSEAAIVEALIHAFPGVTATRYLSAAGFVVLIYDHVLLLGSEVCVVWKAKWSYTKCLFLWSRYFVPSYLLLNAYVSSGLSIAGLSSSLKGLYATGSCKTWLPASVTLGITSLAVTNIFIVQRVWALWGRNTTILKILIGSFTLVYLSTYIITAIIFTRLTPEISYSPELKSCIVTKKPTLLIAMYGTPFALDVFIFLLTCWNAFDRPRHMEMAITRQLVTDGIIYFVCIMTLRLFNIIVIAAADVSYSQLGAFFLWSMITVLINRMLILSGAVEVHPGPDPSGRETPFNNHDPDFFEDDNDGNFLELELPPLRSRRGAV